MKHWDIFLKLQTDLAYPHGPICDSEHVEAAAPTLAPVTSLCVIGPGGPKELDVLGKARTTAVTPLHKEWQVLTDMGYTATLCDVHELSLPSATFDGLFASNVLEHCFAPYIALMQCRRVLREGGLSYFILPRFADSSGGNGPFHLHCLSLEVWRELLRKTGHQVTQHWEQPGRLHAHAAYHHFVCRAVALPEPHAQVLQMLEEAYA